MLSLGTKARSGGVGLQNRMSARLVSASLFGNCCWAGSKQEDVSCKQVTQTNASRSAWPQPSQLGKVPLHTHLLWSLQQCERAVKLMDVTPTCGLVVGCFFHVLWRLCRAETRNNLPFEVKTDVLLCQSWYRRLRTDQQASLLLKPWLSSVAHACAMTRLCLHLLASCCLMQCWPAAGYSLDRVQQPWVLPPLRARREIPGSSSSHKWAFVAARSPSQIFLDAELRGRIQSLLIVA